MSRTSKAEQFFAPYRVTQGKRFRLSEIDPADTGDLQSEQKDEAELALALGVARLAALQDKLYASGRWAVLAIFQAMDAAGKDSAIKHVMSGVNPQGCQVFSFKAPSAEELAHDYLWRCVKKLPERGRIGIFNRSYYEEVLVARVHPEILRAQPLPTELVTRKIWKQRFQDIAALERYLARNGVKILKFFLHVSKDEQKKRFLARLDEPEKNWKFAAGDVKERDRWDEYMNAYEDMIRNTASSHAPWYVVPANSKWYAHLVIAAAMVDALEDLDLRYPLIDAAKRRELAAARAILLDERRGRKSAKPSRR